MNIAVHDLESPSLEAKACVRPTTFAPAQAPPRRKRAWRAATVSLALSSALLVLAVWSGNPPEHRFIGAGEALVYVFAMVGTGSMALMLVYTLNELRHARSTLMRLTLSFRLQAVLGIIGSVCVLWQSGFGSSQGIIAAYAMLLMVASAFAGCQIYSQMPHLEHDRNSPLTPQNLALGFGRWLQMVRRAGHVRRQLVHQESTRQYTTHLVRMARNGLEARVFVLWKSLHVVILALVIVASLSYLLNALALL